MKIAVSSNSSWNIYNFRKNILKSLQNKFNCKIYILCPDDKFINYLDLNNVVHIKINLISRKISILNDFMLSIQYLIFFIKNKPDIYISFTIKPNFYGSFFSNLMSIKTINNFTGLGTIFYRNNLLLKIFKIFLKKSIKNSNYIFFHNQHDMKYFLKFNFSNISNSILVPGSGIDLNKYNKKLHNINYKKNSFLFFGRLMKEKGIIEFLNAAKYLKENYNYVHFSVLGPIESNESDVRDLINIAIKKNIIKFYGFKKNIISVVSNYECVVLPSYHEGMSKAILESGALYKPVIASNIPGINDIIIDDFNGYLINKRDTDDLIQKILKFIKTNEQKKIKMSYNSRLQIEKYFNEEKVIKKYYDVVKDLL